MVDEAPFETGEAGNLLSRILDDVREATKRAERAGNAERERAILRREDLFPLIEREDERLIVYHARFNADRGGIEDPDIPFLTSLLHPIGTPRRLALMIHSPGGAGELAEKIVDICRSHCQEEFSVIVAGKAKSAATLIALGSDTLLMGYTSELGPTDPQVQLVAGGVVRRISAFSVIRARQELMREMTEAATSGTDFSGIVAQLTMSTMEPAFVGECQRMVDFSYDFASKSLRRWMLRNLNPEWNAQRIGAAARRIANNFLSSHQRFSHGRMIGPQECIEIGLNVNRLERDATRWLAIQELHARCDTMLAERDTNKIIFTQESILYG